MILGVEIVIFSLIENTKFFFPLIHLYYKIKENKEV